MAKIKVLKVLQSRKKKRADVGGFRQTDSAKTKHPVELSPAPAPTQDASVQKSVVPEVTYNSPTVEEMAEKYPILSNGDLIKRFLAVPLTNNQKGRIRQVLKDNLKDSSSELIPEVINNKIVAILKSSEHLTDTDLRKIRILHNMLKTATERENSKKALVTKKKKTVTVKTEMSKIKMEKKSLLDVLKKKEPGKKVGQDEKGIEEDVKTEDNVVTMLKPQDRVKGPKRYVVFIGNLPYDIDEETIMRHFTDIVGSIKDVRIPTRTENKKGGIAYIELKDETSYQLALSKNHSMLGNRRINVLYTTTGKSKVDKSEAKGKVAKLVALQKSGMLLGSTAANKKRSFRRRKQRDALARAEAQT